MTPPISLQRSILLSLHSSSLFLSPLTHYLSISLIEGIDLCHAAIALNPSSCPSIGATSHKPTSRRNKLDFSLIDLTSSKGTKLNGTVIQRGICVPLKAGDKFSLGESPKVFRLVRGMAAPSEKKSFAALVAKVEDLEPLEESALAQSLSIFDDIGGLEDISSSSNDSSSGAYRDYNPMGIDIHIHSADIDKDIEIFKVASSEIIDYDSGPLKDPNSSSQATKVVEGNSQKQSSSTRSNIKNSSHNSNSNSTINSTNNNSNKNSSNNGIINVTNKKGSQNVQGQNITGAKRGEKMEKTETVETTEKAKEVVLMDNTYIDKYGNTKFLVKDLHSNSNNKIDSSDRGGNVSNGYSGKGTSGREKVKEHTSSVKNDNKDDKVLGGKRRDSRDRGRGRSRTRSRSFKRTDSRTASSRDNGSRQRNRSSPSRSIDQPRERSDHKNKVISSNGNGNGNRSSLTKSQDRRSGSRSLRNGNRSRGRRSLSSSRSRSYSRSYSSSRQGGGGHRRRKDSRSRSRSRSYSRSNPRERSFRGRRSRTRSRSRSYSRSRGRSVDRRRTKRTGTVSGSRSRRSRSRTGSGNGRDRDSSSRDRERDRDRGGGRYQKKNTSDNRNSNNSKEKNDNSSSKYQPPPLTSGGPGNGNGDSRVNKYQPPTLDNEADAIRKAEARKILLESEWQRELVRREREAVVEHQKKEREKERDKDKDKDRDKGAFQRYSQTPKRRGGTEAQEETENGVSEKGTISTGRYEKYESYEGDGITSNRHADTTAETEGDADSEIGVDGEIVVVQVLPRVEGIQNLELSVEKGWVIKEDTVVDEEEDGQCEGELERVDSTISLSEVISTELDEERNTVVVLSSSHQEGQRIDKEVTANHSCTIDGDQYIRGGLPAVTDHATKRTRERDIRQEMNIGDDEEKIPCSDGFHIQHREDDYESAGQSKRLRSNSIQSIRS